MASRSRLVRTRLGTKDPSPVRVARGAREVSASARGAATGKLEDSGYDRLSGLVLLVARWIRS